MPINMQGAWTVSVQSKEPGSTQQRFTISGADTGNGTYAGNTATPPVSVTGASWAITVEHNSGSGWVTSFDQITFPTRSGGQYSFHIQANDDEIDPIFDDLVLTCTTPITLFDYVIYGNASHYSDFCIFNPCSPIYLVIDTHAAFARALQNPTLKAAIQALYPDRVKALPPGPIPDPPPFKKIVLPLRGDTPIPTQIAQVFNAGASASVKAGKSVAKSAAATASATPTLVATQAVSPTASMSNAIDRVAVSGIVDNLFRFCQTGPLAGRVLRFLQYDRTNAELAGGPYTGTGARETLGVCTTDRNGNYIFRFQRSFAQYLHEASVDIAPGEGLSAILPDVIVQLLDPMRPGGFCYESAPFWNIPFFEQVNICVPDECVGRIPTACQGHNAIQSIGNIFIGAPTAAPPPGQPPGYGARVGFSNSLGADGRITAKNVLPGTPQARCAAWFGLLDFFACFLDHPEVTHYTIRFRPHGTMAWNFFTETYIHPQIAKIGIPGYSGDLVGPQLGVNLQIDGGPAQLAPAYLNIENDPAWVFTHRDRKAVITSSIYAPTPGAVDFRIEGYNLAAGGAKVAAADDTITLYIDNPVIDANPDYGIDSVSMQMQTGGDCALFNLGGLLNPPLTVRFHANQLERFMNAYGLSVRKGNIGGFGITGGGPGQLSGAYVHTGDLDLACNSFEGTFDDPAHDGSGAVTADITATSGRWLDPGQPFCTFAINIDCSVRMTNGYNDAVYSFGTKSYLLGIQAA
jgi:hypothetical protein